MLRFHVCQVLWRRIMTIVSWSYGLVQVAAMLVGVVGQVRIQVLSARYAGTRLP